MNEHQNPGGVPSGRRDFPSASPGGNSPVLGGPTPGMGDAPGMRAVGLGHASRAEHTQRELPHRMVTRRDETVRAGEHRYARPERQDDSTLPTLAMGIGGGLLFGWLLSRLTQSDHREHHWEEERPYSRQRRSYEYDASDVGMSRYAPPGNRSVVTDETWELIASNKVEGTAVYDRKGERLGSVYNFMVGKRSGQVAYAVMSFGGWLGMGESYGGLLSIDVDTSTIEVLRCRPWLDRRPSLPCLVQHPILPAGLIGLARSK